MSLLLVAAPALASDPITLGEAMRLAADATPSAAVDEARAEVADARVARVRTGLLPELSLSGGATAGTGNVVAGGLYVPSGYPTVSGPPTDISLAPGWQALGGATLRLDLLGLIAGVRETDQALAASRAVTLGNEARRQARATEAGLAWLDVAEANAAVDVAREDVARARRVLDVAEALASSGVRPDVERALAASDLALAGQRLASIEGARDAALARLAVTIGVDPGASLVLAEPPRVPPTGQSAATHPAVEAALADVDAAEAGLAASRARYAPRLDLLGAGWVRAGVWPPDEPVRVAPSWSAGVVVEVPLVGLAATGAEVHEQRALRDEATAVVDAVRLDVEGQRAEALALLNAAQRAEAQVATVTAAAEAARGQAEARFEAGLVDVTVVATALARSREAELLALRARFDVLRAALTLAYASGDLTLWTELDR